MKLREVMTKTTHRTKLSAELVVDKLRKPYMIPMLLLMMCCQTIMAKKDNDSRLGSKQHNTRLSEQRPGRF
jgi:hypothetical protein